MVTIKKIADLCGVSRGTVDRVINDRGNVKPETKELVLNMARQLGYKPNPAGKALSARKKHPVVGVLLSSEGNPFFDEVELSLKQFLGRKVKIINSSKSKGILQIEFYNDEDLAEIARCLEENK